MKTFQKIGSTKINFLSFGRHVEPGKLQPHQVHISELKDTDYDGAAFWQALDTNVFLGTRADLPQNRMAISHAKNPPAVA